MTLDPYNLHRFIEAQEGVYPQALEELQDGRKRSHWMWYIFPQLAGLGRSYNSNYYGISGLKEAKSYLEHPVLGPRLREVSETILSLPTDNAAESLNSKIKAFRSQLHGVSDLPFFMYRLSIIFG